MTTTDLAHVPDAEGRGVVRLAVRDGAVHEEALAAMSASPPGRKPAGDAIRALAERLAPASTLGDVQRSGTGSSVTAWRRSPSPTAEAGGTLTVTCASAVWAQELDLMSADLVARLNDALGAQRLSGMRCQSVPAKSWSRSRA